MNTLPFASIEALRAATPGPMTEAQKARMAYAALPPLATRPNVARRFGAQLVRLGLTLDPDALQRLHLPSAEAHS